MLAASAQASRDRFDDLTGRQIDELSCQLANEAFEVELLIERDPWSITGLLGLTSDSDGSKQEPAVGRLK
jgi:hypothetical protein